MYNAALPRHLKSRFPIYRNSNLLFRLMYNLLTHLIKLITMHCVVCSKLCGDNLQRSTKQTGLSEQHALQEISKITGLPLFSSLCQRRQSSHYFWHQPLLCSDEERIQSMVGGRSWTTKDNLQSGSHHQSLHR